MNWLKNRVLREERVEQVRAIKKIADDLGVSLVKLSLAWCLKNPNVSTVILGASKVAQLKENLEAIDVVPMMSEKVMEAIEEVLKNKPVLPEY